MNIIQIIAISLIGGITEVLPVSSTGHMIILSKLIKINKNEVNEIFNVAIQIGSILGVVINIYNKNILIFDKNFYKKIFIAFIPILFVGFLSKKIDFIKLEKVTIISLSMLVGGILLVLIDFIPNKNYKEITYSKAFLIGLFQCLAIIPGLSRSGITITSAIMQNIEKKTSIYFCFFLGIPTIIAATIKKTIDYITSVYLKNINLFNFISNIFFYIKIISIKIRLKYILIGGFISFFTSFLLTKIFIKKLNNNFKFKWFGYYRIVLSIILFFITYYKL